MVLRLKLKYILRELCKGDSKSGSKQCRREVLYSLAILSPLQRAVISAVSDCPGLSQTETGRSVSRAGASHCLSPAHL